jgi:hypothetical protein
VATPRGYDDPARAGSGHCLPPLAYVIRRARGRAIVDPTFATSADGPPGWLAATMRPDADDLRRSPVPRKEVSATMTPRSSLRPLDVIIRIAIVGLTLGTAYIHSTLGGLLFTLNAAGYVVAALAIVIPLGLAVRFRWFIRLGLMGYAATAILAWAVQGPYYTTAYIAKAIEVSLIVLLAIDFARMDGNPIQVVKSELGLLASKIRRQPATGQAGA